MRPCARCGEPLSNAMVICPKCGDSPPRPQQEDLQPRKPTPNERQDGVAPRANAADSSGESSLGFRGVIIALALYLGVPILLGFIGYMLAGKHGLIIGASLGYFVVTAFG